MLMKKLHFDRLIHFGGFVKMVLAGTGSFERYLARIMCTFLAVITSIVTL